MAKHQDKDLFAESTMTFGEHLEELRGALVRSLIGLAIGFLISLVAANQVVKLIERPLKKSLQKHYRTIALTQLDDHYEKDAPEEAAQWINERSLIPSKIYIEADQLKQLAAEFTLAPMAGTSEHGAGDPESSDGEESDSEESDSEESGTEESGTEESGTEESGTEESGTAGSGTEPSESDGSERETMATASKETGADELEIGQHDELPVKDRVSPDALRAITIWKPISVSIQTLNAHEAFMIWIKAALVSGALISSPWVFFQIWNFVAAGLYPNEKHYVYLFMPMSLGLFLAGAALAFFFVFDPVLDFLFGFNRQMNIDMQPRISEWISFVLLLPLGFGISFQLPLVMLMLERIGVFTIESYLSSWRIAVLIIFVIAMFLTPADPISMLLMAVPLTVLFFGGVALCRWLPRGSSPIGRGVEP